MGRRRIKSRCSSRFNPDLLTWMPMKKEFDTAPPKKSVYKRDFRDTHNGIAPEMLVRWPKTSFDGRHPLTTSYRYAHGTDHPNRALLSAMSNEALHNSSTNSNNNRVARTSRSKETVGTCLIWYSPENKPRVPAATPLCVPHPPNNSAPAKPLRNNFMTDSDASNATECKDTPAIAAL